MSDSLIPVAPGFETPLEMLEACHGRLQGQLETLARLAAWLPAHGADDQAQQAASAVMRYFDLAAANHHMDEEDDLFPVLLARVDASRRAQLQALIDWILADHRRMFAAWALMRERLAAIAEGKAAELAEEQVEAFANRYRQHIAREESELLPYARELLTGEDIAALSKTMVARRRQG
ncbi:hemerythrin domain-containing protein [Zoogloeaceae bacteirum Par-f-2]|uniref:hemerythrin domain-containing protein n=1 Tax=Pseudothauera hydrothermalis TaxID=2184083 RepID=UPI000D259604|nr:hemerythrin domain-containing protein [Pseudothauera hydrothermalis]AVZ79722.1 hemerythrin domain-containing protein [Zoogloeaceae bacteirum Par-f-2]